MTNNDIVFLVPTAISQIPTSAPAIQLTTVPALSKRTGSLLANAASINNKNTIGSSTPNVITISATSRPLKILPTSSSSPVASSTNGKNTVPVIHVISPSSVKTSTANVINGNGLIIGTSTSNVTNIGSISR